MQKIREQIEYGQFSCTWDNVVCGLCHVDVVIRVDNGIITLGAAQDFDGAVCDDFVCVHISTRSGAALDAVNEVGTYDLCMVDGSWMAEFTENGVLANLSEMGYSFDDDIIPATTTICKVARTSTWLPTTAT